MIIMKQNKTKLERIDTFMNGWQLVLFMFIISLFSCIGACAIIYLLYMMYTAESDALNLKYTGYGLILGAVYFAAAWVIQKVGIKYMATALTEAIDNPLLCKIEHIEKYDIYELIHKIEKNSKNKKKIINTYASNTLLKLYFDAQKHPKAK